MMIGQLVRTHFAFRNIHQTRGRPPSDHIPVFPFYFILLQHGATGQRPALSAQRPSNAGVQHDLPVLEPAFIHVDQLDLHEECFR